MIVGRNDLCTGPKVVMTEVVCKINNVYFLEKMVSYSDVTIYLTS